MESVDNHCTIQHHTGVSSLPSHWWPGSPSFRQPLGSLQVVVLGEVGDEGDGHTHVDASSDGDGQHGQEEGSPGAGAGLMEVSFGHSFVRLQRWQRKTKGE